MTEYFDFSQIVYLDLDNEFRMHFEKELMYFNELRFMHPENRINL